MGRIGGRSYVTRCHVCRRRKVKCDGQTPSCERCIRTGLLCTGYERQLEFAYFDGQSEPNIQARQSGEPAVLTVSRVDEAAALRSMQQQYSRIGVSVLPYVSKNLTAATYKAGFVAVLRQRYLPDVPKVNSGGEVMCEGWIAIACDLSSFEDSDMLGNSLLAMALTFAGAERRDSVTSSASMNHYSRALMGLRTGLEAGSRSLSEHQVDAALMTCLACALYEMTYNKSFSSLLRHLRGVGALLKDRGVDHLRSSPSRRVFWEYRAIELTVVLVTRRSSFLALPSWLNPPWRHLDSHDKNYLTTLIDIAIQIPLLMETFDGLKSSAKNINSSILEGLLSKAWSIQLLLDRWEINLRGGDKTSKLYIARLASHADLDESGNVFASSYEFPSFDIASALMFYEATQIYLYGLLRDMCEDFRPKSSIDPYNIDRPVAFQGLTTKAINSRALECSDRICQSTDYFFEPNKRIIGRIVIMFPFESARALIARMADAGTEDPEVDALLPRKLKFCDTVAQRFRDEGLPTWDR